jgi:hypothetical protein
MLHCFNCGADLPDNILFCLQCGKPLETAEEETVVRPKPIEPWPVDPKPVEPLPIIEPVPAPVRRRGSGTATLVLGVVLGAGLVIALLIVGVFVLTSVRDKQIKNTPPVNTQVATANNPIPTTTPTRKPTATPTTAPANSNMNAAPDALQDCAVISPDGEGTINLRRYCDTRDCSQDASTLYLQVDPGTKVQATSRKSIVTGRYTWVQIKYAGELLWVSDARLDCEHDF